MSTSILTATEGQGLATPSVSEQQRRGGVERFYATQKQNWDVGCRAPWLPTAVLSATPQPVTPGLTEHLLRSAPGTRGVAEVSKAWFLASRRSGLAAGGRGSPGCR